MIRLALLLCLAGCASFDDIELRLAAMEDHAEHCDAVDKESVRKLRSDFEAAKPAMPPWLIDTTMGIVNLALLVLTGKLGAVAIANRRRRQGGAAK